MTWHPALDDIEERPDGLQSRARPAGGLRPELPVLGIENRCWCGKPTGHDWPGKAGGAAHPRVPPADLARRRAPRGDAA